MPVGGVCEIEALAGSSWARLPALALGEVVPRGHQFEILAAGE